MRDPSSAWGPFRVPATVRPMAFRSMTHTGAFHWHDDGHGYPINHVHGQEPHSHRKDGDGVRWTEWSNSVAVSDDGLHPDCLGELECNEWQGCPDHAYDAY